MTAVRRVRAEDHGVREGLCELLTDAVHGGASIGFLAPLTSDRANAYWDATWRDLAEGKVLLIAEEGDRVVGAVQLEPGRKENGRHRGEVQKLFVLGSHRGRGISRALLEALEREARGLGLTTLTLDTERDSAAESVYRHLGWTRAGEIPDFALTPSGKMHATVYYYKLLA